MLDRETIIITKGKNRSNSEEFNNQTYNKIEFKNCLKRTKKLVQNNNMARCINKILDRIDQDNL